MGEPPSPKLPALPFAPGDSGPDTSREELGLGAQPPATLEQLLDAARTSPDRIVRMQALDQLRGRGLPPEAVPSVVELLKDEDSTVRMLAVLALEALAPTYPEVAEAFVLALKDRKLASLAARALGQPGAATEALVPRLLEAVEEPGLEEGLLGQLGLALAKLGAREVVPVLARVLERPDSTLRESGFGVLGEYWSLKVNAARALRELGPLAVEAVPVLMAALRESTGQLQLDVARALVSIGTVGTELEELLCTVLPAAQGQGREGLLDELAELEPQRDASLRELLTPPGAEGQEPRLRWRARILRAMGGREDVIERVQAFTRQEDAELRSAAAEALGVLGRPTEPWLKLLARRLESSQEPERAQAVWELRLLGSRAGTLLPGLMQRLPQLGAEASAAVLSVLGPLSGGSLDEALRVALAARLGDQEPRIREAVLWALCDFSEEEPEVPRLARSRLEDPDPVVRELARAVLRAREGALEEPSPAEAASPSARAAAAVRTLAFTFYKVLREGEGNRGFSPLSLFTLLTMVLRGTRGHTESALRRALHWSSEPASLMGALRELLGHLHTPASAHSSAPGAEDTAVALVSANGLFAQEGYPVRPEYLAELAETFGMSAQTLDFVGAPREAIAAMNAWAREQTRGHIPALFPSGPLPLGTRYVLANTVYFRAAWERPFEVSYTRPAPFSLLDGQQVQVPMMVQPKGTFGYASGAGYQLIELPYRGGQTSMVVLLPDAGFFERFERLLTVERMEELLAGRKQQSLMLTLPRFSFEQGLELSGLAERLGLSALHAPDVDLSGMTSAREPFRGALRHDARVTVDEKGTVAAASSSSIITLARPSRTVEVNRPFLFLIRHEPTRTVLFLGRVTDPRSPGEQSSTTLGPR